MIVFTVYEHNYDDSMVHGVFISEIVAQRYIDNTELREMYRSNFVIEEWEVAT